MAKPNIDLAQALENDLLSRFGPIIGNDDLRAALGYPSREAFRQASARGQLPVPVFVLPKRRGKFALVKDIAGWLARSLVDPPTRLSSIRTRSQVR